MGYWNLLKPKHSKKLKVYHMSRIMEECVKRICFLHHSLIDCEKESRKIHLGLTVWHHLPFRDLRGECVMLVLNVERSLEKCMVRTWTPDGKFGVLLPRLETKSENIVNRLWEKWAASSWKTRRGNLKKSGKLSPASLQQTSIRWKNFKGCKKEKENEIQKSIAFSVFLFSGSGWMVRNTMIGQISWVEFLLLSIVIIDLYTFERSHYKTVWKLTSTFSHHGNPFSESIWIVSFLIENQQKGFHYC